MGVLAYIFYKFFKYGKSLVLLCLLCFKWQIVTHGLVTQCGLLSTHPRASLDLIWFGLGNEAYTSKI